MYPAEGLRAGPWVPLSCLQQPQGVAGQVLGRMEQELALPQGHWSVGQESVLPRPGASMGGGGVAFWWGPWTNKATWPKGSPCRYERSGSRNQNLEGVSAGWGGQGRLILSLLLECPDSGRSVTSPSHVSAPSSSPHPPGPPQKTLCPGERDGLRCGRVRRGRSRGRREDGGQAGESQAARSDRGQRPVPMTLLPAALITNRVPDRCWRPGLRSSCSGLTVSHSLPFTVCSQAESPGGRPFHTGSHTWAR